METAFQAIERVLKDATPETTVRDVALKANVTGNAIVAYMKRRKQSA